MEKYKIVAITNCPAGIAHTYMVAEAFEKRARELGHEIHVETQGASGVENRLTDQQIEEADYVILAMGKTLTDSERARFNGKKVINMKVSDALKEVKTIFDHLEERSEHFEGDKHAVKLGKQQTPQGSIMSHLMAGISAALPFVIGGGVLVAMANVLMRFGMAYTSFDDGGASFAWIMEQVGYLGFKFMIPIMGAYIANSIGDKPALAPAFIITYFANDNTMLGTESGCGFFGAIFFGLTIGYFVKWIKGFNYPQAVKSLMNLTVIPFVTILLFGSLTFYLVGPFLGGLMSGMLNFLNGVPAEFKLPLAFLIGAMLAFDMGGPINKIAWFFCFSLVAEQVYIWYAIVGVVASVPPVAAGLASIIWPKMFSKEERDTAVSAIVVGATVATEPAIPFAMADPIPMITANTLSGGLTGVVTILLGIERLAPGIGVFDPLLGLMTPGWAFYVAYAFGVATNILFIVVFKNIRIRYTMKKMAQKSIDESGIQGEIVKE
ncbi:fructose-like PTS system EIIBC component [Enterococcus florum]|uniref:Fructose-like PTS system EIIBC component n=1 Tax=Enterococcus florum TaxID=2480627 RepID=A0A4P5PGM7_9ENTE|nr:fructose-specific PTS transporter subunit EIIC [Enterococcus florum]GCF95934.1 fructose-like PTS system EIIBC component [Enterococcus florum]